MSTLDNIPPGLFYVDDDGARLPVTNLYDRFHGETTDRAKAAICVAKRPDGQWLVVACEPDELEYTQ